MISLPESYPFPTYSGLFEPKHYKQIGTALWFFLWCVSSTTKEEEVEGVTWGLVLGNKPMKLSELAEPFGVDDKTVSRWLKSLEEHSYIRITRAPYGLILAVRNSKKFRERSDKNVRSDEREQTNLSDLSPTDQTKMSDLYEENGQKCPISIERSDKNVRSNKDIKILNNTATTAEPLLEIIDDFCKLHHKLDFHVKTKERMLMNRMIAGGMPVPFIIKVMRQVFEERTAEGTSITSFLYYEQPIFEAWKNEQSITATVPTGGVALGRARKSRQQLQNEQLMREIREAEERDRQRGQEAFFDHQQRLQRL